MYLYTGHSASTSLEESNKKKKKKESLKKATNSDLESRAYSQKYHAPHTIYSMYFFL